MKKEDREMIEKIMATEKVGYAYMVGQGRSITFP